MSIQTLKKSLHELIDSIEDAELLAAYYKIISAGKAKDWWEEISEEERGLIKKGIKEAEEGVLNSHEDVMKEVNQILKGKK